MNYLKTTSLLLLALLTGCRLYTPSKPPTNYYYINPEREISSIGRTALVELTNNSSYPQMSDKTTEALFQALQKKTTFRTPPHSQR